MALAFLGGQREPRISRSTRGITDPGDGPIMTIDLADPATVAVGSAVLFCVALLLGLPSIRRVTAIRRFQRLVGTLFWRFITALDRHNKK